MEQLGEQGLAEPLRQWRGKSSGAKHNRSPERDTWRDRTWCHLCTLNRGPWVPPSPQQHPPPSAPHHPTQTRLLPLAAAAPSFADMGNAIGSLIMLGKGRGQEEEEEDSVLLSEEHSLILTCCWVSVKVGIPPHGTGERGSAAQHPSAPFCGVHPPRG